MAKFITGKELEDAVYSIIWDAEQTLMIVSPFVKLDNYFNFTGRISRLPRRNPRCS